MCFNVSITKTKDQLEELFNAKFIEPERYQPIYHVSAFSKPFLPVITNQRSEDIQLYKWGLIPFWVKEAERAEKIRFQTGNAKSETIFEKPSFRSPIRKRRCLVLVDGFYEWQGFRGKNYPYYVYLRDHRPFAMAGIWDSWKNPETEDICRTFSVITTRANPMMARIHNKKERMPVILKKQDERRWLSDSLEEEGITSLMTPYDENEMEAYTVSKLVSRRDTDNNVPEVMEPYDFEELHVKDLFSF